jgi:hypothetical protein
MATETDTPTVLSPEDERRVLWLTVTVVFLLLGPLALTSYLIWGKAINIMYVPIAIIEWAFAGGMVSVLYRLTTRRGLPTGRLPLYTWAIAKPVIGLFMGSLVYFLALAGAKLLDASPPSIQTKGPAAVATPQAAATPGAFAVATPAAQPATPPIAQEAAKPVQQDPILWLNIVAFVGGFSEELSVGLINRFVRRRLGEDSAEGEGGDRHKPVAERAG